MIGVVFVLWSDGEAGALRRWPGQPDDTGHRQDRLVLPWLPRSLRAQ